MYVNFWELLIGFPNGGQWAPSTKFAPPGSNLYLRHCSPHVFFTMPLTKDLCRRMSAKDWSEWPWAFSFYGVENWLLLRIMCGTKRLNHFSDCTRPLRNSINIRGVVGRKYVGTVFPHLFHVLLWNGF